MIVITRCRGCCSVVQEILETPSFQFSSAVGLFSACVAIGLHKVHRLDSVLLEYVPDDVVFNVFVTFCSLVTAFRTAHALTRYTEASAMLHRLKGCWFDSASTLISFCRVSKADVSEVMRFQQTLVRLLSLLNAFALDSLQHRDAQQIGHHFELISPNDLNDDSLEGIMDAKYKVEFVFQMIQQNVIDMIETGVIGVPAPIVTRVFQDLAQGLQTYHEARKLVDVPLPAAYACVSGILLSCLTIFVPFMMAIFCKGYVSSFFYTFFGVGLTWFLNGVAESLGNPFRKEARTLDAGNVQRELNDTLVSLVQYWDAPTVTTYVGPDSRDLQDSSARPDASTGLSRISLAGWTMESVKSTKEGRRKGSLEGATSESEGESVIKATHHDDMSRKISISQDAGISGRNLRAQLQHHHPHGMHPPKLATSSFSMPVSIPATEASTSPRSPFFPRSAVCTSAMEGKLCPAGPTVKVEEQGGQALVAARDDNSGLVQPPQASHSVSCALPKAPASPVLSTDSSTRPLNTGDASLDKRPGKQALAKGRNLLGM